MITYKLIKDLLTDKVSCIFRFDGTSIPIAPDNTDYQNFKNQINADEAQLEDADGNLMTAEQAKEFVSKLA